MPSILRNARNVDAPDSTFIIINGDQVNHYDRRDRGSPVHPSGKNLSRSLFEFVLMTPRFLHNLAVLLTSSRLNRSANTSTSPTAQEPQTSRASTVEKTPTEKSAKTNATGHPSWKAIIMECITLHTEDAHIGVSRQTLKKFAQDKYTLEPTGSNVLNLNHALSYGVQKGLFVFPKGPSGRVKLAPKGNPGRAKNEGAKSDSVPKVTKAAPAKVKKLSAKATVKLDLKEIPGASTKTSPKTVIARKTSTSKVRSKTAKAKVAASKPRAKAIGKSKTKF